MQMERTFFALVLFLVWKKKADVKIKTNTIYSYQIGSFRGSFFILIIAIVIPNQILLELISNIYEYLVFSLSLPHKQTNTHTEETYSLFYKGVFISQKSENQTKIITKCINSTIILIYFIS